MLCRNSEFEQVSTLVPQASVVCHLHGKPVCSKFEQMLSKNTEWDFRMRFCGFHLHVLLPKALGTELSNNVYRSKRAKRKLVSTFSGREFWTSFQDVPCLLAIFRLGQSK